MKGLGRMKDEGGRMKKVYDTQILVINETVRFDFPFPFVISQFSFVISHLRRFILHPSSFIL
jgi:hypothetical protein